MDLNVEVFEGHKVASMFSADRFVIRDRVSVRREDGTRLSDIDLLVFDRRDACVMLIQTKWLLRPDYVTEVLAKDEEINAALAVTNQVWSRVEELGPRWLADVLEPDLGADVRIFALLVNKDFLPSGWIHNSRRPVVDMIFLREFVGSAEFVGIRSLYEAASGLDRSLSVKFPVETPTKTIKVGDYTFEVPGVKSLRSFGPGHEQSVASPQTAKRDA
jgi:hypothetical protein